jgi:hypothetical protein
VTKFRGDVQAYKVCTISCKPMLCINAAITEHHRQQHQGTAMIVGCVCKRGTCIALVSLARRSELPFIHINSMYTVQINFFKVTTLSPRYCQCTARRTFRDICFTIFLVSRRSSSRKRKLLFDLCDRIVVRRDSLVSPLRSRASKNAPNGCPR